MKAIAILLRPISLLTISLVAILSSVGHYATSGIVLSVLILYVLTILRRDAERLSYLREKYGDEMIVQRIFNRQYWSGQTAEQLRDSLGDAVSVDGDLLKTKKREVWKYGRFGRGQYRLRITLDQDVVIGVKSLGR